MKYGVKLVAVTILNLPEDSVENESMRGRILQE